jgi:hypothetical protein
MAKTRADYEAEGYAAHTWRLSDCPYTKPTVRDAWQAGAWRWQEEQRGHPTTKRAHAAKLDREIATALKKPKRAHATMAEPWEPFAKPDWPVVLDMLEEHKPDKAAVVWRALRKEDPGAPRPESFERAFRKLPADVKWKFEDLTARTGERYVEAINNAIYQTKDPDALIEAVKAAKKHRAATKRVGNGSIDTAGGFDHSMSDLANLLVKAEQMVKNIKTQRKTGKYPKPSRRTAWKLR